MNLAKSSITERWASRLHPTDSTGADEESWLENHLSSTTPASPGDGCRPQSKQNESMIEEVMLIGAPSPEERCGRAAREASEDLLEPTSFIPVLLPIGLYLGPVSTGRSWQRAHSIQGQVAL